MAEGGSYGSKYEEAIGSVPKGLKKGSAACRWMNVSMSMIDTKDESLPENNSKC